MTPAIYHAENRQRGEDERAEQIRTAKAKLWQYDKGLPWPWKGLHAVGGPIQPGHIDLIAADSGSGKTTLVASLILEWLAMGAYVVFGGYELGADEVRRYLACLVCGFNPGEVLGGEFYEKHLVGIPADDWKAQAEALKPFTAAMQRIEAEISAMEQDGVWERLFVMEHDYASRAALMALGHRAHSLSEMAQGQVPVVSVVDHIDHLEPSDNEFRASKEACMAVKDHAKQYGTRWVVTSQLNRAGNIGGDSLWKHRPLFEHYLKNGGHKKEISTRTWGLYRPLRSDLTAEDLKAYKEHRVELGTLLMANANALNVIKHRPMGSRTGAKVLVGWDRGRIVDAPPSLVRQAEAKDHGIRTSFGY